ncbi:hypothetical protein D770_25170 [Flammeovirgaceae bacterium 311]|nr:hypothetical protein D770_25170 [Flammeovirgaceae bacterium 311]
MNLKSVLPGIIAVLLFCFALPADGYAQGKGKNGPPPWAPAHGYRAKTRHIYFPQHNFYFDVQRGVYIYLSGGNWLTALTLPSLFGSINLAKATQIELDYTADNPNKYNADHKVKYKSKPQGGGGASTKKKATGPAGNSSGHGHKGNGKGKKH